jgi:prepilin-type N-terminal cleavage/methylation domain-containing protein
MKPPGNNSGFTLIELIVTAVIINILAAIAIVGYIGTLEKSRVARITRTASASTADLQLWLQSSFNAERGIREVDTNFDGVLNVEDKINEDLLIEGVASIYIEGRNTILRETSPWFNRPLWNSDEEPPNGTINLTQPFSNQLIIIAKEKNGVTVYETVLFSN